MLFFVLSLLNSHWRESRVKFLAPKPSILILKCASLVSLGIWELRSKEIALLKELGSGHFGVIHLGKWKGQGDVAVKVIKDSVSEDEFFPEAQTTGKILLGNRGLILTIRGHSCQQVVPSICRA